MRPSATVITSTIPAPLQEVFALLVDPAQMPRWLPGCQRVQASGPLHKGSRITVDFGGRSTEFEIVDFGPPHIFGWIERGHRSGWRTSIRLDFAGGSTTITLKAVWNPPSFTAWLRGTLYKRRAPGKMLDAIVQNLRMMVTK